MPKFENSLETQLSTGLEPQIKDWACGYMSLCGALQITTKKKFSVNELNILYNAAKNSMYTNLQGDRFTYISKSGAINDYYKLNNYIKDKMQIESTLQVIGTKDPRGLYMYPAYANLDDYDYQITTYQVATTFGEHIVLRDSTDFIIYNPNKELELIEPLSSVLLKEI